MSTPADWVEIPLDDALIARAKAFRQERDARFGVRFPVQQMHERAMGDVGEKVLHEWLKSNGIANRWNWNHPLHEPDLTLASGQRVDVKTRRCKPLTISMDYDHSITDVHALDTSIDWFFLIAHHLPDHKLMRLMGAIRQVDLMRHGTLYLAGSRVHMAYTVEDHNVYSIAYHHLIGPPTWLAILKEGMVRG